MPAQNQEPDLSFDIPAKELLGLMEQSRKRALEFGSAGSHQAAYESNREYRMYAGMLETSGMADQIRHASRVLTRMNPMQAQRLAARLPEQYEMQSRTLGINWDRYDQRSATEHWSRLGMSKEYADLASAYFAGDYQNDPVKARRAAQMMRHMKPGPNGQLDAESVAQGVRSFEMFETERTNFGGQLTDLGLPEESVNAVSDTMAGLSLQTGMDRERMMSAFQGFYETRLDQRARGMATEDLSPQDRAVAARQAKAMMGQLAGMVQENPLVAPMVEQALSGRGGLELNFESATMRTPQGLATEMKRVYERGGHGYEEARQLHREGHIPATDIPKYTAAVLYKHAGQGVFQTNPDLEQYIAGVGRQIGSKAQESRVTQAAVNIQASPEAPPEMKRKMVQVATVSLGSTPEGRAQLDARLEANGVAPDVRAKVGALVEQTAPLADYMLADERAQKSMDARTRAGRLYAHGIQEPGDFQNAANEMRSLRDQLAATEGTTPEDLSEIDEVIKTLDTRFGEQQTVVARPGDDIEAQIRTMIDTKFPPPETIPGDSSTAVAKREARVRQREEEEARIRARAGNSRPRADVHQRLVRGLGAAAERFRIGATHAVPLSAIVKDGAPDMKLGDIYTDEQLAAFRPRGADGKSAYHLVGGKVDLLLEDLEVRGLLRESMDDKGRLRYQWEPPGAPGYNPDKTRKIGQAPRADAKVKLGDREIDLSTPEGLRNFILEKAPTPEVMAELRKEIHAQVDLYGSMRDAHEAMTDIRNLGVDLGDPKLLPSKEEAQKDAGLSPVAIGLMSQEQKRMYLRQSEMTFRQQLDLQTRMAQWEMENERERRRAEERREERDWREQEAIRRDNEALIRRAMTDDELRDLPVVRERLHGPRE
jgi:hypothetical protein